MLDPRDRLIVALDVASVAEAEALVARLGDVGRFLQDRLPARRSRAGSASRSELARDGKQVFVDSSCTISATRSRAAWRASRGWARPSSPCTPIRRPCTPRSTRARGSKLRILAVTVLTSYDDADLAAAGYDFTVAELVAERAAQARDIGVDGLVCSARRGRVGAPDRRRRHDAGDARHPPAGAEAGDQKRIMTPAAAIKAGADYLVVGRPIVAAADPKAAADAIVAEIAEGAG